MRYLVDSNVLLRLLQRNDSHHSTIRQAIRALFARPRTSSSVGT